MKDRYLLGVGELSVGGTVLVVFSLGLHGLRMVLVP